MNAPRWRKPPILELTRAGLFCPAGGFYIDPSRAVERAVITHSHSDHARSGSQRYYCVRSNVGLLRSRVGGSASVESVAYGERLKIGDAWVSFHPAGHILGSAQVRTEVGDQVWVVSGDYKRDEDPTCEPFEVVRCDVFITEATFGLPIYRWQDLSRRVVPSMVEWWRANAAQGLGSVLFCYSLGKAQRVMAELARLDTPEPRIFLHPSALDLTRVYAEEGVKMIDYEPIDQIAWGESRAGARFPRSLAGQFVIAPPGAGARSLRKLGPYKTAFASGWMQTRGPRSRRGGYDRGFVVSDHADFPSLVRTVLETGASKVLVTHGNNDELSKFLRESHGLDAEALDAALGGL